MSIPSLSYDEIKAELRAISQKARIEPLTVGELVRANELVGMLVKKGLKPRALGLSLRRLGLNPRRMARRKK